MLRFFFLSSVCFRPEGSVCVALSCGFHTFLLLSGPEADLSAEEETSGYESEGSRSRSPSAHAKPAPSLPASPPAGRRPRTAFTAEQIDVLERAFKKNAYLGTQDKAELCRKLRLSDKQVSCDLTADGAATVSCGDAWKNFCPSFLLSDQKLVPEPADEAEALGSGRPGARLPGQRRLAVPAPPRAAGLQARALRQTPPGGRRPLQHPYQPALRLPADQHLRSVPGLLLPAKRPPRGPAAPRFRSPVGVVSHLPPVLLSRLWAKRDGVQYRQKSDVCHEIRSSEDYFGLLEYSSACITLKLPAEAFLLRQMLQFSFISIPNNKQKRSVTM